MGKKKAIKKPVMPKGVYHLGSAYIKAIDGRLMLPGTKFTSDDVTPERLAELKEKGLVRGTLTTEQKGTITK
jgi:hypothetical protein